MHNRKASNALCILVKRVSDPGENCQRNLTDLADSLVTSCRPPGQLQSRPDDRASNAGVAVRTADDSQRTTDAGDEQYLRCGWMQQSVMYCGTVLPATWQMLATSNV